MILTSPILVWLSVSDSWSIGMTCIEMPIPVDLLVKIMECKLQIWKKIKIKNKNCYDSVVIKFLNIH